MNEFQKAQRSRILSCYNNADKVLEKAKPGEGSRGGKIVGYTKGGNPIYDADQRQKVSREEEVKSPRQVKEQEDPKLSKNAKKEEESRQETPVAKLVSTVSDDRWKELDRALANAIEQGSIQQVEEVGEVMTDGELSAMIEQYALYPFPGSKKMAEVFSKIKASRRIREEHSEK